MSAFHVAGFWCNLVSDSIHKQISVYHHRHHHHTALSNNRKVLAAKFDFTPFLPHRHHKHHHRTHVPERPQPVGNEIDPHYGVEKRLVPTGPNPLHH
ncbi:hypothetical protein Dsin_005482 [Dipteronia sinensis]|uniref:Uncharacterized protein n=1 Tax=Dipteronia sinensis TaxID=43782 RepID=A0AAE0AXF8_9ROSI|nr:hypothetical protein Dsin_005482 [Dipteronia sinensis]